MSSSDANTLNDKDPYHRAIPDKSSGNWL